MHDEVTRSVSFRTDTDTERLQKAPALPGHASQPSVAALVGHPQGVLRRQQSFPLSPGASHGSIVRGKMCNTLLMLLLLMVCDVQCKHQLAARLAFILKSCPIISVSDAALAEHLLQA